MRPNLNIAPVEWPYRETDKSPGDVVITNVGRAMPQAAPALMLRTAPCFTVAARWVSIRIAGGIRG